MTRRWLSILMAAPLVIGCGKMGGGPGGASASGAEHDLVGAPAPAFELPAQHGAKKVSLADGAGKVMIVDFWATWCEPCKDSFPHYQSMLDKHAGQLVIVGISEDDDPDGIDAFAKETNVKFPLAWDEGKSASASYAPPSMPTAYLIDRHGIVRFVHVTFKKGDEAMIEGNVESLLK